MKAFKNAFMAIFILAISTGIFYFTIHDKKLKENILDSTLGIIGEQLFAVVPNSPQKDTLKKRYQSFLGQVENEEIAPEKIELVAAGMINIVNNDTVNVNEILTLFDVDLDSSFVNTKELDTIPPELEHKGTPKPPVQYRPYPKPWTDDDYQKIGTRLKHIQNFQSEMARSIDPKELKKRYFVVADSGLQIIIDDKIRESIKKNRKHNLERQIAELERNHLIDFRFDYENMKYFHMAERDSLLHIQLEQLEKNLSRMLKNMEENNGWFESLTSAQQDSIKNIIKKESKMLKSYKSKHRKQ